MRTPVLLIAFARPATTREVLEAIRAAQPPRLYIAVDGPRKGRSDDERNVRAVRALVEQVDWPCEVKSLFSAHNLGVGYAPPAALDWFFAHEEEGIVLEDDCVPTPGFFPFCEELLEKFRDDENVAQICGSNFANDHVGDASYYFTKYADIWGWASWSRAWRARDMEMTRWPSWRDSKSLHSLCGSTRGFVDVWTLVFDNMRESKTRPTWDYQWMFTCWERGMISISPRTSLVRNVGFGGDAAHVGHGFVPTYSGELEDIEFPLVHPSLREPEPAREREIARRRYLINPLTEAAARVASLPLFGPRLVSAARRIKRRIR